MNKNIATHTNEPTADTVEREIDEVDVVDEEEAAETAQIKADLAKQEREEP